MLLNRKIWPSLQKNKRLIEKYGTINSFRDKAKEIAQQLNMTEEFEILNSIIGALLSTKPSGILSSGRALARAQGVPFDQERVKS